MIIYLNKPIYDCTSHQYIKAQVTESYDARIKALYNTPKLPENFNCILDKFLVNTCKGIKQANAHKTKHADRRKLDRVKFNGRKDRRAAKRKEYIRNLNNLNFLLGEDE